MESHTALYMTRQLKKTHLTGVEPSAAPRAGLRLLPFAAAAVEGGGERMNSLRVCVCVCECVQQQEQAARTDVHSDVERAPADTQNHHTTTALQRVPANLLPSTTCNTSHGHNRRSHVDMCVGCHVRAGGTMAGLLLTMHNMYSANCELCCHTAGQSTKLKPKFPKPANCMLTCVGCRALAAAWQQQATLHPCCRWWGCQTAHTLS